MKSLEAAVLARVPKGTEDLNRKALEAGVRCAQKFLRATQPRRPRKTKEVGK